MSPNDMIFTSDMDWSAPEPTLPIRSRLINLKPIEREGPQSEGLISYIIRLARAHSVNPRTLVRTEFTKVVPEISSELGPSFFREASRSLEGTSSYASHFTLAAGSLTRAGDLRDLTLMPLRRLLPPNAAGLLARNPKWCPSCFAEMVKSDHEPYRPLAWSFQLYRFCSIHGCRLVERCVSCGNQQHFIPRYPSVCNCSYCGAWLGGTDVKGEPPSHVDLWISAAVEDVVSHLAALEGQATQEHFLRFLESVVHESTNGSRPKFCQLIGISSWTLTNWFGGFKPSFPQWLTIAYGLEILPTQFLTSSFSGKICSPDGCERPTALMLSHKRPPMSRDEQLRLGAILSKIATDPEDTTSLTAISKRFNYQAASLRHWFPEQCALIQTKFLNAIQDRKVKRLVRDAKRVEDVVKDLVQHGDFPGEGKVNLRLRKIGLALVRPELREVYRDAVNRFCHGDKPLWNGRIRKIG